MVKFQMTSGVLKLGENLENIEESRRIGFLVGNGEFHIALKR